MIGCTGQGQKGNGFLHLKMAWFRLFLLLWTANLEWIVLPCQIMGNPFFCKMQSQNLLFHITVEILSHLSFLPDLDLSFFDNYPSLPLSHMHVCTKVRVRAYVQQQIKPHINRTINTYSLIPTHTHMHHTYTHTHTYTQTIEVYETSSFAVFLHL